MGGREAGGANSEGNSDSNHKVVYLSSTFLMCSPRLPYTYLSVALLQHLGVGTQAVLHGLIKSCLEAEPAKRLRANGTLLSKGTIPALLLNFFVATHPSSKRNYFVSTSHPQLDYHLQGSYTQSYSTHSCRDSSHTSLSRMSSRRCCVGAAERTSFRVL